MGNLIKCNTCPEFKKKFGKNITLSENRELTCNYATLVTIGYPTKCPIDCVIEYAADYYGHCYDLVPYDDPNHNQKVEEMSIGLALDELDMNSDYNQLLRDMEKYENIEVGGPHEPDILPPF